MQIEAAPDALWRRAGELIAQQIGLDFSGDRRSDLQRGLTAAAAELGFADAPSCAEWLLSASPTRPQWQVITSHLTIGETYFFRERKSFDALAEHVLPELIGRRRGREQRLRLWCAACSTGEEPYSLAILLRELLPDWKDWSVTILATDINERSLQKAAAGVYGEWSFRESSADFKERYFTAAPKGRFAIVPEIKSCVRFAPLNLAQDWSLSPMADADSMDMILCRNVLIYFTAAHTRKLAENLHRALVEGGWLAVSPSECSQSLFSSFTAVNFPGAILYRKGNAEERSAPAWQPPSVAAAAWAPAFNPTPSPTPWAPAPDWATAAAPPAPQPSPPQPPPPRESEAIALKTRALANQGQHADALASCKAWIASDKVDPAAHYVYAMILQEMGEPQAARESLQRAVYLQPEFVLAHISLGNLARADARAAQANRHFANALQLLRGSPPDALLPESDGLSAGRLTEMMTRLLAEPDRPVPLPETSPHDER